MLRSSFDLCPKELQVYTYVMVCTGGRAGIVEMYVLMKHKVLV